MQPRVQPRVPAQGRPGAYRHKRCLAPVACMLLKEVHSYAQGLTPCFHVQPVCQPRATECMAEQVARARLILDNVIKAAEKLAAAHPDVRIAYILVLPADPNAGFRLSTVFTGFTHAGIAESLFRHVVSVARLYDAQATISSVLRHDLHLQYRGVGPGSSRSHYKRNTLLREAKKVFEQRGGGAVLISDHGGLWCEADTQFLDAYGTLQNPNDVFLDLKQTVCPAREAAGAINLHGMRFWGRSQHASASMCCQRAPLRRAHKRLPCHLPHV
jgi:hypothetical protein